MSNQVPLLLVSGAMCTARLWSKQLKYFKRATPPIPMRVIELTEADTIEEHAHNISKMPDLKLNIVGFSAGGYVAREFSRICEPRVNRMVLISTPGEDAAGESQAKRRAFIRVCEEQGVKEALAMFTDKMTATYNMHKDKLESDIRKMVSSVSEDEFLKQLKMVYSYNDKPESKWVTLNQSLLINAEDDCFISHEGTLSMQSVLPEAKVLQIPEGGHMLPLSTANIINAEISRFCNYTV